MPGDVAFQTRVLMAALGLLDRESGPVLIDCTEDVPDDGVEYDEDAMTGMVCAIDLPKLPDANAPASVLGQALLGEIDGLAPWYDLAVRSRGRTTVGPSGLEIKAAAKFLADFGAEFPADLAKFSAGLGRFLSPLACVVAAYVVEFSPLLSDFCFEGVCVSPVSPVSWGALGKPRCNLFGPDRNFH